jgi:hypothetical protein
MARLTAMKALGRILQIIGLIILPLSMLLELTDMLGRPFGVSDMLIMLIFGVVIFSMGRLLQRF